jgi:hypothetical protein
VAQPAEDGEWGSVDELLERGEQSFVDAIRRIDDADALVAFAERWYRDARPRSRELLLEYLERPLNAFRHEALIKRLFKLAEGAGDDECMARFLVLFDRSVRRIPGTFRHRVNQTFSSHDEAILHAESLRFAGFEQVKIHELEGGFEVLGSWSIDVVRTTQRTVMPRGEMVGTWASDPTRGRFERVRVPDWVIRLGLDAWHYRDAREIPDFARKWLEAFRLFSIATRHYLRRRSWRFFRRLGRLQPERYVAAISRALVLYDDDDCDCQLSIIDNWGLLHVLYHGDPALVPKRTGWTIAADRSLDDLRPAPIYASLWSREPRAIIELLSTARCGVVLRWAVGMARQDVGAVRGAMTLDEQLALLQKGHSDVVSLAVDLLRDAPGLEQFTVGDWASLVDSTHPSAVEFAAELMGLRCDPSRVSWSEKVALSTDSATPLARLGFSWLQAHQTATDDVVDALPKLLASQADAVRLEIAQWSRRILGSHLAVRTRVLPAFLEARYSDVRDEGWAWVQEDPALLNDVGLWRRLSATPYDDVRMALVAHWEERIASLRHSEAIAGDGELVAAVLESLWASVLLFVHGRKAAKPTIIAQILDRMRKRPSEAAELLHPLAVALGSSRGPELRAGLSAVVRFAETGPDADELVRAAFPELQFA